MFTEGYIGHTYIQYKYIYIFIHNPYTCSCVQSHVNKEAMLYSLPYTLECLSISSQFLKKSTIFSLCRLNADMFRQIKYELTKLIVVVWLTIKKE